MSGSKYSRAADRDYAKVSAEKLRVSFEYLDLSHQYFFVHSLEPDHYRKVFDCINEVANSTEDQIVQQTHPSLEPKSIFNTTRGIEKQFPEQLEGAVAQKLTPPKNRVDPLDKVAVKAEEESYAAALKRATVEAKALLKKRAFEVRIGRAYGRIHGFVWNKVFYVVWFDPAHNLYPDDRHGGLRLARDFAPARSFHREEVLALKETNQKLVDEFNQLQHAHEALQLEHNQFLEAFG